MHMQRDKNGRWSKEYNMARETRMQYGREIEIYGGDLVKNPNIKLIHNKFGARIQMNHSPTNASLDGRF